MHHPSITSLFAYEDNLCVVALENAKKAKQSKALAKRGTMTFAKY
jgi:hypothetical protein